jgi:hypothetical protein
MDAAAQRTLLSRLIARDRVKRAVLAVGVLAASTFLVAPAAAAGSGGSGHDKGNLQPLWKSYPLDSGAGRVGKTPAQRARTHQPTTAAEHSAGGSGGGTSVTLRALAAGGVLLLMALATLLVLRTGRSRTAPTKGERMSWFTNKMPGRDASGGPPDDTIPEVVAVRDVEAVRDLKPVVIEDVSPEPPPPAEAPPEPPQRPSANERAQVGAHVETVLKAAEEAAAQLVAEARAQAQEIRESAERESSSRHAAAADARAAAEDEAAKIRLAAEQEAEAIRAAAERHAATYEQEAEARYDELLNDTELAEDRLHRLVEGLRGVADRLDDLLAPEEDEAPVEAAEPVGEQHATLEDALDPGGTKAGAA